MLGPCLFLYYINDLPAKLHLSVRLFADDTIAYLVIRSHEDADLLQENLVTLAEWEEQWRMTFHPSKCTKMTVTGKRDPILTDYDLHGHTLANVPSAKYLGVAVTQDLKWDTHIQNICVKANQTKGFLRRNLNIGAVSIKQQAYFSLVRPLLEYFSNVWDLHTQKNIKKLEMVQCRAARYVLHRHRNTSSVTDMLQTLNWRSLESSRKYMRLCMMFKIDKGLVAISKDSRLIPQKRPTKHSHSRAFQTITCGTEKRRMSFFPRTVRDWNAFPPDIPDLKTLE